VRILAVEDDPAVSVFFSRAVRPYRSRIRGNTDGGADMWRGVSMTLFASLRNWYRFVRIVGRLAIKLYCCACSSHCKGSGLSRELSLWSEDVDVEKVQNAFIRRWGFQKAIAIWTSYKSSSPTLFVDNWSQTMMIAGIFCF
jgi:hypothetical protein